MKSHGYVMLFVISLLFVHSTIGGQQASFIDQMTVYDTSNSADWSIQSNLQIGNTQFGDRSFTITSLPATYLGASWIRTANDSKGFAGDTLVTFRVTGAVDVLVVYDDRLTLRDWLKDWTDTGDDMTNDESPPKTFSLYVKSFQPNDRVALGAINQTSGADNYIVIVRSTQSSGQTPDPFDFLDAFDVTPDTEVISEPVTITGISAPTVISLSRGAYSINGGAFQSSPGYVDVNDQVRVRLQSASGYGQVTTAQITVGSVSARFSVRTEDDPETGWAQVPGILARIQPPVFPERAFLVTDFGAIGDGKTMCTDAFAQAIEACSTAGGGQVIVPEGVFLTGAIHLLSNVNLHLQSDATIQFSQNPADFLPVVFTRFEGTECWNYSPPVYAFEQENIAITGSGTLNGGGDASHWWSWTSLAGTDVSTLRGYGEDDVPVGQRVFGSGHYLRPNMIQPYRCKNVLIDSVTIRNSPMWHIHPVLCENVTVSNVSVIGHGPNNDGCNPECCRDVHIDNCYFDTGDDCIAIKSGRNNDGRRVNVATENVVIQNCTMKDGHGGVVIGSEISGGARNIFAEACSMDSPNLDRALRIKTNSIRGGIVENVYLRDITVGQVADAVVRVNYFYGEGDVGAFTPVVRNVHVEDLTCRQTNYPLRLEGYARSPIRDIYLVNCEITRANRSSLISQVENLGLDQVTIGNDSYQKIINPAEVEIEALETASLSTLP